MTEKEFNLSEKISQEDRDEDLAYYHEKDVKEFIRRLKEEIINADNWEIIDKIFGEELNRSEGE